jgi:hypothetical protein
MKESAIPTFTQVSSGSSLFGLSDRRNSCSIVGGNVGLGQGQSLKITLWRLGDNDQHNMVVFNSLTRRGALKMIS